MTIDVLFAQPSWSLLETNPPLFCVVWEFSTDKGSGSTLSTICIGYPHTWVYKMSGQSILDRMTAAKHSIAGSGLAKVVCKSTTEEVMGPKKKHLDCKCFKRRCFII